MSLEWVAAQLALAVPEKPGLRFNPHPPGVIREGSATEAVLQFLAARGGAFFNKEQIVERINRSGKAVDWALIFLRDQELIEAVPDSVRNPRFRRYRITPAGVALAAMYERQGAT